MHELSVAMSVLEFASEEAERQGGVPVLGIHLRLGPLAGVVEEALQFAYEVARESLPFVGQAKLVIERVPVAVHCPTCCEDRMIVSIQMLCCPECGTPTPDVVSGRELEVVALEFQS